MNFAIGIDLGATRVKAAVVNDEGRYFHEINVMTVSKSDYELLLQQLLDIADELIKKNDGHLKGIGLGVAGLVDANRGLILSSPNLAALRQKELAKDLSAFVQCKVVMDNDANMMARGEGKFGAASNCHHFIAITLGTGVGGAVVSADKLIRGYNGGGGEIGHIPIHKNGECCGCGSKGCLEAYIGQAGIRKFISANYPCLTGMGLKELNLMADRGDDDAKQVYRYIGENLGIALAGLVNVFNPRCIIVGGGVSGAGELFMQPLREEVTKRAFKEYTRDLHILTAQLGNWAGVIGAADAAMEG